MNRRAGLRSWELWVLVVLMLGAARPADLPGATLPPGLRYDELLDYRMIGRILAGERPLYFAESWGEEPLFLYLQAATVALAGASDWSLRLPAAPCGMLGVLAAWLAARQLWGRRVAVCTAAALAVSFWSIFYSREGIRVIAVTPLHGLMVYFTWRGLARHAVGGPASAGDPPLRRGVRDRGARSTDVRDVRRHAAGWRDLVLGGACMGLAFYVYPAARLMPFLWVAFFLYLALFQRSLLRHAWPGLLLAITVAGLIAAPLLVLVYGPAGAEQRVGQLTEAWEALWEGDAGPVLSLSVQALGMFVWRGEQDWLYNVYGRPIFDPLAGACFILGIALCAWRWRQPRAMLLLLWLGVGMAPAMITPPPASLSHAIAAQPPAYVLMAVGLEAVWRVVGKWRQWAGVLLAAAVVAVHGTLACQAYFATWARAPQVRELHQGGITAVARQLDAHTPAGPVAIGAPYTNYWHPWNVVAFDLAQRGKDLSVRWFNPAGGWVWPAGARPTTFYFPADPLGPQSFDPELEFLFAADATWLSQASDDFGAFRVARPVALEERLDALSAPALAWPPELAHLGPPELPLVFGGRFALLGTELAGSTIAPGGTLRLTTYWAVVAADPAPVVAFVHLTSDGQDVWGQYDWLDVWPAGLQPGDRFVQVHRVPVKPETPPGPYHIQVGLYGPDTLRRLRITIGAGAVADRVWVGQVEVKGP